MPSIAVEKIGGDAAPVSSVLNEISAFEEQTRRRAFELFEKRRGRDENPVEDWLRAERDLAQFPKSDLLEKEGKFELSVEAPGYDADEVEVTALPEAIIVRAQSSHRHEKREGKVHFCEYGEKNLYRRIGLPETIDVDRVTARLDKGVLHLTAPKEQRRRQQTQSPGQRLEKTAQGLAAATEQGFEEVRQ